VWTLFTVAHTAPFVAIAALFLALGPPVTWPVAAIALAYAWIIPELYAARGANAVRGRSAAAGETERRALGLLGDLLGHESRALYSKAGLVAQRGTLGVWLVGQSGALLVRPGGRRVNCYCVKATDSALPPADRVAHLALALREDERGFATVANLVFSGACWRVGRRLTAVARPALNQAKAAAH
jgi:hypothetical protein